MGLGLGQILSVGELNGCCKADVKRFMIKCYLKVKCVCVRE